MFCLGFPFDAEWLVLIVLFWMRCLGCRLVDFGCFDEFGGLVVTGACRLVGWVWGWLLSLGWFWVGSVLVLFVVV